jgi:RNA polymerase sigma-70 factor (ECF subfamily)
MPDRPPPLTPKTINDFKEGFTDAFTAVYIHYYARVCALGKLALKDAPLVDEYVDKFFRCIRDYRSAIGKMHYFDTYLWLTAKHLLRIQRRQMVNKYLSGKEHPHAMSAAVESDIGQFICEELIKKEFYLALDELPPRQRQIFILSREENMSALKIAEMLNIEEQTVHNQLSKANKKLRVSFALLPDDLETWDQD